MPTILRKENERRKGPFDREIYRKRNLVERSVNRLKQFRRLATRYEKRVKTTARCRRSRRYSYGSDLQTRSSVLNELPATCPFPSPMRIVTRFNKMVKILNLTPPSRGVSIPEEDCHPFQQKKWAKDNRYYLIKFPSPKRIVTHFNEGCDGEGETEGDEFPSPKRIVTHFNLRGSRCETRKVE